MEALETLDNRVADFCCPTVDGLKEANERADEAMREPLFVAETVVDTELVKGSRTVDGGPGCF